MSSLREYFQTDWGAMTATDWGSKIGRRLCCLIMASSSSGSRLELIGRSVSLGLSLDCVTFMSLVNSFQVGMGYGFLDSGKS